MTLFMPTITHSAVFTWHSINILQECYACPGTSVMTFAIRPGLLFRLNWIGGLLVTVE